MNSPRRVRWYSELNGYHWFVLAVAALGWLFDTMDQQLFVLARTPAMQELLRTESGPASANDVNFWGGISTSIFLIGWATGGLTFGVLGDRIGRARTMLLTILIYSLCTGLSAFSRGFWDFAAYRFLTGLGVGGEFAVGVALVAEVMPDRARPFALGLLQALSAVGNITAALINIQFGILESHGLVGQFNIGNFAMTSWRLMFLVGTLPALLAIAIRWRLKEPEQWKTAVAAHKQSGQKLGSYAELFGDPRWRHRALVGLTLAFSGVVGLWAVGFFLPELSRSVLRKQFVAELRAENADGQDRDLLLALLAQPQQLPDAAAVKPEDLISPADQPLAANVLQAMRSLAADKQPITREAVIERATALPEQLPQPELREPLEAYLSGTPTATDIAAAAEGTVGRANVLKGKLTQWAGTSQILSNIGGFFGIYGFTIVTSYIGRRAAFAISYLLALSSTLLMFGWLDNTTDALWMAPLMGFCQLSLFGGFAIYFPELFPTRLRSTGVSFCYNVGRFVAAVGPFGMGALASTAFGHLPAPLPLRYAGMTMCTVFLLGLAALPFAPETKDRPLPE